MANFSGRHILTFEGKSTKITSSNSPFGYSQIDSFELVERLPDDKLKVKVGQLRDKGEPHFYYTVEIDIEHMPDGLWKMKPLPDTLSCPADLTPFAWWTVYQDGNKILHTTPLDEKLMERVGEYYEGFLPDNYNQNPLHANTLAGAITLAAIYGLRKHWDKVKHGRTMGPPQTPVVVNEHRGEIAKVPVLRNAEEYIRSNSSHSLRYFE